MKIFSCVKLIIEVLLLIYLAIISINKTPVLLNEISFYVSLVIYVLIEITDIVLNAKNTKKWIAYLAVIFVTIIILIFFLSNIDINFKDRIPTLIAYLGFDTLLFLIIDIFYTFGKGKLIDLTEDDKSKDNVLDAEIINEKDVF